MQFLLGYPKINKNMWKNHIKQQYRTQSTKYMLMRKKVNKRGSKVRQLWGVREKIPVFIGRWYLQLITLSLCVYLVTRGAFNCLPENSDLPPWPRPGRRLTYRAAHYRVRPISVTLSPRGQRKRGIYKRIIVNTSTRSHGIIINYCVAACTE